MRQVILALAALLLGVVPASAQRIDRQGVPYRAWDIDAGFGFHSMTSADAAAGDAETYFNNWTPSWATSFDAGYFWNHHLKTEAGLVLGTPAYLAPEIVGHDTFDGRVDIYSLGCVAYWLLTGRPRWPTTAEPETGGPGQPPIDRRERR